MFNNIVLKRVVLLVRGDIVDRNNDVLAKYDFKVYNINRARGAFLLDTDSGLKILKKVDNNKNKILFEHKIKEHLYELGNEMVDVFLYNKEGNIITTDNQQNNFEIIYYKHFEEFYDQAIKAEQLLKLSSYKELLEKSILEKRVCHGNYTYHNILLDRKIKNNIDNDILQDECLLSASNINNIRLSNVVTVNFDKSYIGLQLSDLYYFIRKVMENY